MNFFVIIPAHNEEKRINEVIYRARKQTQNIIVVDDGSKDQTAQIAEESGARIIKHKVNLGKGAALKTGCDAALKLNAEAMTLIDADNQHNPEEIPKFIEKLEKGCDIVFGVRKTNGLNKKMPLAMLIGNKILTKIINALLKINVTDTQSGFRAFTKEAYLKIKWSSSDYFVETEMLINSVNKKLKYAEIPIETIYHDAHKGTTFLDGIKILFNIIIWKLI